MSLSYKTYTGVLFDKTILSVDITNIYTFSILDQDGPCKYLHIFNFDWPKNRHLSSPPNGLNCAPPNPSVSWNLLSWKQINFFLLKVQLCNYKWTWQPKCTKLLVFVLLCKQLAYDAKKLINKHSIHRYHMKIILLWCPNWFFHSKLSTKNTNYTNSFQCNSTKSKKRKGKYLLKVVIWNVN